jgi:hypothetical protein
MPWKWAGEADMAIDVKSIIQGFSERSDDQDTVALA